MLVKNYRKARRREIKCQECESAEWLRYMEGLTDYHLRCSIDHRAVSIHGTCNSAQQATDHGREEQVKEMKKIRHYKFVGDTFDEFIGGSR